MQAVDRNVTLLGVGPDLFGAPERQRIDLDDASVRGVDLQRFDLSAGRALSPTHAGNPAVQSFQGTLQWFDLANAAALFAVFKAVAK